MSEFDRFWEAYPRKTAKVVARKAFDKALSKIDVGTMLRALAWQRNTEQWQRGVIPHPATWLNQERWSDEPIVTAKKIGRLESQQAQAVEQFQKTEEVKRLMREEGLSRSEAMNRVFK